MTIHYNFIHNSTTTTLTGVIITFGQTLCQTKKYAIHSLKFFVVILFTTTIKTLNENEPVNSFLNE